RRETASCARPIVQHGIVAALDLVQVRDAELSELVQVLDVRAGLLDAEDLAIALEPAGEELARDVPDGARLAARRAHAVEPLEMERAELVDRPVHVRDPRLGPAETELDPADVQDLVERLEVAPQPAEERDAFRRLMRRGAREDVVAGEQHVVDLQADL